MKYILLLSVLLMAVYNKTSSVLMPDAAKNFILDPVEAWQGQTPSSKDVLIGIRYAKNLRISEVLVNNEIYHGDYSFDGETLKLQGVKSSKNFRNGANFVELVWNNGDSFLTVVKARKSNS